MNSPAQRSAVEGDALTRDQWDIVCLSHKRWGSDFERPQQLMTRFARDRRVLFVEEPVFDAVAHRERMECRATAPTITLAVPHLRPGSQARTADLQRKLLDDLISRHRVSTFVLWYWNSSSVVYTHHLTPEVVIFDCIDKSSGFSNAPAELSQLAPLDSSDVLFAGKAPGSRNPTIDTFPSGVDVHHFARARQGVQEPADQAHLPRPRFGCFGVVDERMDLELLEGVARRRPGWHWVIIGPTSKIASQSLPRAPNIHYLGIRPYKALPDYLAGWDVAVLPFARDTATQFISPMKAPEYLVAGCAVVSTSICDVVRSYGTLDLIHVADTVDGFVAAAEAALREDRTMRLARVDALLADASWDAVVRDLDALISAAIRRTHRSGGQRSGLAPVCDHSP